MKRNSLQFPNSVYVYFIYSEKSYRIAERVIVSFREGKHKNIIIFKLIHWWKAQTEMVHDFDFTALNVWFVSPHNKSSVGTNTVYNRSWFTVIADCYQTNACGSPIMGKTVKEIKCFSSLVLHNLTEELATKCGTVLVLSSSAYLVIWLIYLRQAETLGTKLPE